MRPCRAGIVSIAAFVAAIAVSPSVAAAASADFGDAPDGARTGYVSAPAVVGHFPSKARSRGAHHADATGALRLGALLDVEADSKQVDRDKGDDGFFAKLRACRTSTLTFVVNADALPAELRAAGHTAYLNALADWNRDGRWKGASRCGGSKAAEWAVKNRPVDMAAFADEPIQPIQVTVRGGPQVKELWMRATLTLDEKMTSAGRGAFARGETEDSFLGDGGPSPEPKGKTKKGRKRGPRTMLVDCFDDFMFHGTSESFPVFFTDPGSGKDTKPKPGSVDVAVANTAAGLPLPGDVSVKAFSYGYRVTSLATDERGNPLEFVFVLFKLSPTLSGLRLEAGPAGGFSRQVGDGVELVCMVLVVHTHHTTPTGGGPPAGNGGGPIGGGPPGPPGPGTSTGQPPVAGFTYTPNTPPTGPKAGEAVHFDGSSSHDPDGTIRTYAWSVGPPKHGGGGTVSTSGTDTPTPTISFPSPGVYPVTLTVTDDKGNTAFITKDVFVSGAGSKSEAWATDPADPLGCSGTLTATQDIYIPTYAQTATVLRFAGTGGCAGATVTITKITRQSSNAPPDEHGSPRVDEWGNVKDTVHIEFTVTGGSTAQGTIPFTVNWQ